MHVVIFEGIHWKTFAPLSLTRPVFMLATGMATLLEKQIRHTNPSRITLWVRPELEEIVRRRIAPKLPVPTQVNTPLDDEPALLLSGRTLHFRKFPKPEEHSVWLDEGDIVRCAYVQKPGLSGADVLARSDRWKELFSLPKMEARTRLVERLWDLIKWNEESLIEDHAQLKRDRCGIVPPHAHVAERDNVWIAPHAHIKPGVYLDGSRGPVVIEDHATIGANAVIEGPCFIGPYATITPLTHIRPGTSISTMCKVGGCVSNSILFGYTNKSHEGYLGDSYVGKWVNLGAGTTTSNLKNTYGEITVKTAEGDVKTGRRFLGAMIGDHTKTAIGTRLMAGTYVGFSSTIASSDIPPKSIPSFQFLTDKGPEPYRVDKAIEVMKQVYSRRDRVWDELDEHIVRYVERTAPGVEGT